MAGARELTQDEIDAVFKGLKTREGPAPPTKQLASYDFRRPDRIAKSQLRAIHILHTSFVRNLVSSLSVYLRSYFIANLVSVEQLPYAEFLECVSSPTCIALLSLRPYEGNAVLEIAPSLIFPIIEILLGGTGKTRVPLTREITKIEKSLLDGLFRIILRDLQDAWKGVSNIDFTMDSLETDPKFLQILAPSEAVVAIGIEIRSGEHFGMMNIAMPSIILKMMDQKFDQQRLVRKTESSSLEQGRVLELIRPSKLILDACVEGPTLRVEELIHLQEGDILSLDYPVEKAVACKVNGKLMFNGGIVSKGQKLAFVVENRVLRENTV